MVEFEETSKGLGKQEGPKSLSVPGKALPPLSPNLARIMELASRQPFPMAECIRAFESDAGLSARLLKLVNSSYFGLPRRLASVGHAARMLGERGFQGMAMSLAAAAATPRATIPEFDVELFWRDGLMRALAARETVGRDKDGMAEEAFAAALLQNLGIAVFAVLYPKEYSQSLKDYAKGTTSLSNLEDAALGLSHAALGAHVAEQWRLPERTVKAIARHHDALASSTPNDPVSRLVRSVQLSAMIPSMGANPTVWKNSLTGLQAADATIDWLNLGRRVDVAYRELAMLFLSDAADSIGLADRWEPAKLAGE